VGEMGHPGYPYKLPAYLVNSSEMLVYILTHCTIDGFFKNCSINGSMTRIKNPGAMNLFESWIGDFKNQGWQIRTKRSKLEKGSVKNPS